MSSIWGFRGVGLSNHDGDLGRLLQAGEVAALFDRGGADPGNGLSVRVSLLLV
jgi:hypothetical protein